MPTYTYQHRSPHFYTLTYTYTLQPTPTYTHLYKPTHTYTYTPTHTLNYKHIIQIAYMGLNSKPAWDGVVLCLLESFQLGF